MRNNIHLITFIILFSFPACMWEGMRRILPWNINAKDTVDASIEDTDDTTTNRENPENPSHQCACEKSRDGRSTEMIRCDSDGDYNKDGDYLCCPKCHKICMKIPTGPMSKNPSPIPVPDCKLGNEHCKWKEKCKIIGGDCCAGDPSDQENSHGCHQQCPIWNNEISGDGRDEN